MQAMEGVLSGGVVVWQTMPVRSSRVRSFGVEGFAGGVDGEGQGVLVV